MEFLEVLYALFGFGRCALLKVGGFAEELLGCDLEERGGGASAVYPGGVREECVLTCTAAGARFLTLPEPSRDMLGGAQELESSRAESSEEASDVRRASDARSSPRSVEPLKMAESLALSG